MQKITPFLWFESRAREAGELYVSLFGGDSKIKSEQVISDTPSGRVEIINVDLRGQEFSLMSAGPLAKFNESISFVIDCDDQAEVDHFWYGLTADGGEESQCGWLKDKFGVSWQVVPKRLNQLMSDPDKEKSQRVTQAMLGMKRIVISELEKAYAGEKI